MAGPDSKSSNGAAAMALAPPSMAVTVLLVLLWYTSSMLAITSSKLTMQAAKVPLVLCSAQFLGATLVSGSVLAATVGPSKLGLPGSAERPALGGVSVTYTLGFFFTNLAFSLAHASFVETVKSGEPISTVALAFALLGEREQLSAYVALLPVVAGVAMASTGEAGGTAAAFLATVGSNFGFSARAVFAKQLKRDAPGSTSACNDVCLFYHISWTGLLMLLPLAVYSESGKLRDALATPGFDARGFAMTMALNSLMYTAYNQFSFMVLSRVSTASHAVLNVCRRVCVISVTSAFFGVPLSALNMMGIFVAVAGMIWFTHSKTKGAKVTAEDKAKKAS